MKYIINADIKKSRIDKNIYGNFSEHLGRCVYEGMWVGHDSPIKNENGMRCDVVEALREMKLPVLRWPGGCFADTYHWMDGIGGDRKKIVNIHWGGVTEDNSFGTHEFFEFCRQVGCEPYICGNVGSGTVREMQQWVEYINNDNISPMADLRRANGQEKAWTIKYWGVGNENWGCGGNMRAEYYADLYRQFATYLYDYGGKPIYRIACGPNGEDYNWTEVLMREAGRMMQGLSLHYYTWMNGTPAADFDERGWAECLAKAAHIGDIIARHDTVMSKYDPNKRVSLVVDEWGTWFKVEPGTNPGFLYQQSTMRDALVAAVSLNIFNKHSDRVRMANIAQLINVLQAVILTDGAKMVKTPTFYAFKLFAAHQNATLLDSSLESGLYEYDRFKLPQVFESASIADDGTVTVTLCNCDPNKSANIECSLRGAKCPSISGRIIEAESMNSYNDFDEQNRVFDKPFYGALATAGGFTCTLPARSVVTLTIK